ncbi:MAG: hypothetical protein JXB42_04015, partial [Deltaproteobacteria bacterium]|nr:hypothetical protein [Deltaproteobacteria bacterium]
MKIRDHHNQPGKVVTLVILLYLFVLNPVTTSGITAEFDNSVDRTMEEETLLPKIKDNILTITVQDAIMMALANNRLLKVEKLTPEIKKTLEDQQEAIFSPVLRGNIGLTQEQENSQSNPEKDVESGNAQAEVGMSRFYPTGTDVEVTLSSRVLWSNLY